MNERTTGVESAPDELTAWFKGELAAGRTRESIRLDMAGAGWTGQQIDAATPPADWSPARWPPPPAPQLHSPEALARTRSAAERQARRTRNTLEGLSLLGVGFFLLTMGFIAVAIGTDSSRKLMVRGYGSLVFGVPVTLLGVKKLLLPGRK